VLEAVVCLRVGSVDLRLESFSLMFWMILDMAAVVMKSEDWCGCWRRVKCKCNAKASSYIAPSDRGFYGVDDDGHVRLAI